MKYLILVFTLLVSCVPEDEEYARTCQAIGYFNIAQVEIKLTSELSKEFSLSIDGENINRSCFLNSPCFNMISHDEERATFKIYFYPRNQPDTADFSISENDIERIYRENVDFDWKSYSDVDGECRDQQYADISLSEN